MYPPPCRARAKPLEIPSLFFAMYTDKNENKIFLIYKEIQSGAVAKSYMTNGEIFAHFLIY